MENRTKTRFIAQAAIIAALYSALTIIFAPISFGPIQVRIAEALNILPFFTASAIPGLFIGCLLGNSFGGAILPDILFGSLATLIGALVGYQLKRNILLVPLPSIASNALIIPFVLRYFYHFDIPLYLLIPYIAIGEFLGSWLLGEALGKILLRNGFFKEKQGI